MDMILNTTVLLLFLVNPLLYSFLFHGNKSLIKRYVLGQFLVWSTYCLVGFLIYLLNFSNLYNLIPLFSFVLIFPYLWVNRKRVLPTFKIFSKEDFGVLQIFAAIIIVFTLASINYQNGVRIPVFSNSWDGATHFFWTNQIVDDKDLSIISSYPYAFHINTAITFSSFLSPIARLNDFVFRINVYSLFTVYILGVTLAVIYYGLIERVGSKDPSNVRVFFLSIIIVALFSDVLLSVFRYGFFSYLIALGFLGFLFYVCSHKGQSIVLVFLGIIGFVWSYFYLVPILLPLLVWQIKKNSRILLTALALITAASLPLLPFAYLFITKMSLYMSTIFTSPGGYQQFSSNMFLILFLIAAVGLIFSSRLNKHLDDYQKSILYTVVAIMVFQLLLFLIQIAVNSKPDYSFFKPLVFLASMLLLIVISYLDTIKVYIDENFIKDKSVSLYVSLFLAAFILLFSYTTNLAYARYILENPKGNFYFLHPYLYNSSILFREKYVDSDQTVAILLNGSDFLWTSHIIGNITTFTSLETLHSEEVNLDYIYEDVTKNVDKKYAVFDPAFRTNFLCNKKLLKLMDFDNVTFFPERNYEEIRNSCKERDMEKELTKNINSEVNER
jgi:hypothetical protein